MSALRQEAPVRPQGPAPAPLVVEDRVTAADWGLLFLRLALGGVFFMHGSQKVLGWFGGPGLQATVAGFGHLGIPMPLAYVAAFTEFLGGLGLVFGILPRLSALGICVVMIVAIAKVHFPNGFFMNWQVQAGQLAPRGEGFEYHILAIGMALAVVFAGAGRLALFDPLGMAARRRAARRGLQER